MRRVAWVWAIGGVLPLLLPACSLLGLDRFEFPGCVENRCDALNARDGYMDPPGGVACSLWQCAENGVDCTFGPRDIDRDGFVSAECAGGDDCEDAIADAHPGADEICNSADDDCNGLVDDGTPGAAAASVVVADMLTAPSGRDPWTTYAPAASGLAVATELNGRTITGGIVTGPVPLEEERPLVLSTSMTPTSSTVSTTVPGCTRPILAPIVAPRPCPLGTECTVGSATLCVTDDGGAEFCEIPVVPRTPAPLGTDCTAHWQCSDGIACNGAEACTPRLGGPDLPGRPTGCRAADVVACSAGSVCNEAERTCVVPTVESCTPLGLAIAPVSDREWLAATIAQAGCVEGSIHVGHFVLETDVGAATRYPVGAITTRGPATRSTSWLGLDALDGCGGFGRPAGSPRGAAGVGLATLPSTAMHHRPQGVVAYLAAPACRGTGTCDSDVVGGTGPVDVEVAGVWLQEGLAGPMTVGWASATGDGNPTALGVMVDPDVRSVAVASYDTSPGGYLVAYPSQAGGIAVHVIAAFGDPLDDCAPPPPMPVGPCLSPTPPYGSVINPLGEPATSDPLVVPAATTTFASAAASGDVAIATHVSSDGTAVRVLFAWPEASRVVIGAADLSPAGVLSGEEIITMVSTTGASSLAIAHVDVGMALEGATVAGSTVGPDDRGGFVVTWSDDVGTRGVRISDHTGEIVGPPSHLGPGTSSPRAFAGEDERIRVVARTGTDLIVYPAVCGP